jgi:hypothetical protein
MITPAHRLHATQNCTQRLLVILSVNWNFEYVYLCIVFYSNLVSVSLQQLPVLLYSTFISEFNVDIRSLYVALFIAITCLKLECAAGWLTFCQKLRLVPITAGFPHLVLRDLRSHSSIYEDSSVLGCFAKSTGKCLPTYLRNVLPSSSRSLSLECWRIRHYTLSKRR